MSEKEKFSQRLNAALDDAGFPEGSERKLTIAELLNEASSNVGLWLEGGEFPKTSKLVKLAKLANVRSNWLLLGTGDKESDEQADKDYLKKLMAQRAEKKRKANKKKVEFNRSLNDELSKEAIELATDYMALSKQDQQQVKALVTQLLAE